MTAPQSLRSPVSALRSIRVRLPFFISVLVGLALATFLWAAYQRVEATLLRAAGDRAQGAADLIASLLDGRRADHQITELSSDPALRAFLITRSGEAREAAAARLRTLGATAPRRIQVWDAAGQLALEIVAGGAAGGDLQLPTGTAPTTAGVQPLQRAGQTVFTDVVADVRAGPGAQPAGRLGFVRVRSTFVENPPGIFARLVGPGAVVRIGNRGGDIWTDLTHVAAGAPVDLRQRGIAQYRQNGAIRLGAVSPVAGTPWAAWVELPRETVVAPATGFLRGMLWITILFLVVTTAVAIVLAAQVTTPLSALSADVAALVQGDLTRRVTIDREDEFGHFGRAFNEIATNAETVVDALRRSEEGYRRLFESNPHPMWIYDVETLRFIDVNQMAVFRYGYSRDEFLAMTVDHIRPSADAAAVRESVAGQAGAAAVTEVCRHRKKNGDEIDVEISSHELILNGRSARAVLAHDVTEQLRAQRALHESESQFRGMAETMPHIVWTAGPDLRADYYNQRWFEYTGLSADETRRSGWTTVLHPDDPADSIERLFQPTEAGESPSTSFRVRRGIDGAYRWHIARVAPLRNEQGGIAMWVGTCTDVDDARRDQEALETLNRELEDRVSARTAQLEAANGELESFSYSVSHDLRAPLRHVQGYVEMLIAATEGQLSEKVHRYLKTITDATVEMGELIDDLLSFSRIARIEMSQGRVVVNPLVQDAIGRLEMATRNRDIVWQIDPMPDVLGDPSMLKQVYANLIGNAVKYTRHRPTATIHVGCAGQEDGLAVLFVRDNGAGFDMQYAHKLFGVFQRLHRSDEFEGTGIGLATVRRIVARHGGRAWAEGKVDQGATVYFTLRAATPQPVMAEV